MTDPARAFLNHGNVGRLLILRPDSNGVLQSSFMPFFG